MCGRPVRRVGRSPRRRAACESSREEVVRSGLEGSVIAVLASSSATGEDSGRAYSTQDANGMEEDLNQSLNKHAQLMIVVVGFFATVQLLIVQAAQGNAPLVREAVTLTLAAGCAVRYWWVIL